MSPLKDTPLVHGVGNTNTNRAPLRCASTRYLMIGWEVTREHRINSVASALALQPRYHGGLVGRHSSTISPHPLWLDRRNIGLAQKRRNVHGGTGLGPIWLA